MRDLKRGRSTPSPKFLQERVAVLAEAADRIVVYHSENDRALKVAEIIFAGVRAGQSGIRPDDLDTAIAQRLEVIDARAVATGWTRHAPHIESAEVITDLHNLFEGKDPKDRRGLAPISTARWGLHSPTDL